MPMLDAARSHLWLIDFQTRLLPAIEAGDAAIANALKLAEAARLLGLPTLRTEQYPRGLGPTVPELAGYGETIEKMTFGSCGTPAFRTALQADQTDRQHIVTGCEAHVCVLQTVLGMRAAGCTVYVVADAIGSRKPGDKAVALSRMAAHGAEIVTTEMVIFEWLGTAAHPQFRALSKLIR